MLNKKALFTFLGLTFGITISLAIIARILGLTLFDAPLLYSQLVILFAMFVPGISALIIQKFIVKKPIKELGFKFGSWKAYFQSYGIVVLMFIINYGITWLFISKPDFSLNSFLGQYKITEALPMPESTMLILFAFLTFVTAPIFNLIPSLGEEVGWRGFLLPALEPLGKIKAMVLSGLIWGLWHTPLILILGFAYGRDFFPGFILHLLLVTGLGIWMGYVWFKTKSTILTAFIHAVFNANAYGVWTMIFVSNSKLVIGPIGIINTTLFVLLALVTIYISNKKTT